jgi:hypothetical protein
MKNKIAAKATDVLTAMTLGLISMAAPRGLRAESALDQLKDQAGSTVSAEMHQPSAVQAGGTKDAPEEPAIDPERDERREKKFVSDNRRAILNIAGVTDVFAGGADGESIVVLTVEAGSDAQRIITEFRSRFPQAEKWGLAGQTTDGNTVFDDSPFSGVASWKFKSETIYRNGGKAVSRAVAGSLDLREDGRFSEIDPQGVHKSGSWETGETGLTLTFADGAPDEIFDTFNLVGDELRLSFTENGAEAVFILGLKKDASSSAQAAP